MDVPPAVDPMDRARRLLTAHGECRQQPASEWTGTVPLPAAVAEFYGRVGPVDIEVRGYGNGYVLPRLAALWDAQAGYRWHGHTRARLADWRDEWLLVGDCGGDPLIFDGGTGRVSYAHHGEGTWVPFEAFADLPTMAACLAIMGSVIESAGDGFTDDNCLVAPAQRDRAAALLTEVVGSREAADAIVERVGDWA